MHYLTLWYELGTYHLYKMYAPSNCGHSYTAINVALTKTLDY